MAKSSTYRTDIDGLRGLAIALVVFFHVFVGKVSAGVDVFLLIGGVFFFGPQIRNALNPRGLTPVQVVIRMLRRLFPALVVTVTVTLALALMVFPPGGAELVSLCPKLRFIGCRTGLRCHWSRCEYVSTPVVHVSPAANLSRIPTGHLPVCRCVPALWTP